MNTILNQPYRRRVSTDRLNREDNQLAASLESESDSVPGGKTLSLSYPKTRFLRKKPQGKIYLMRHSPTSVRFGEGIIALDRMPGLRSLIFLTARRSDYISTELSSASKLHCCKYLFCLEWGNVSSY